MEERTGATEGSDEPDRAEPPQTADAPPAAPPRKRRKPRKSWKQRLRSELWRHSLAVVIATVFANAVNMALVALIVAETVPPSVATEIAPLSLLSVFAFYGPAYLVLSNIVWRDLDGQQLRTALERTALPDKGLVRTFFVGSPTQVASMAALLSLIAVWVVAIRPGAPMVVLLISLACVFGSWILVMATFSVEYAREWANSDGFEFAGEGERTFGDFVYLAVQVSTTYSSSDVVTVNRRARNLVTIHSLTAFVFGTVILAFLVALVLNTIAV